MARVINFYIFLDTFSVYYASLYINWTNISLFIIPVTIPSFESAYKKPPFIKKAIFSDVILVSDYHGCKGETIKFILYYIIDIIYKTVKPSH